MKFSRFFISEKCVRHPDFCAIGHCEVFYFSTHIIELKSVVIPLLSEGDLDTELHLDVVDLLEAPDEQAADNHGWI